MGSFKSVDINLSPLPEATWSEVPQPPWNRVPMLESSFQGSLLHLLQVQPGTDPADPLSGLSAVGLTIVVTDRLVFQVVLITLLWID